MHKMITEKQTLNTSHYCHKKPWCLDIKEVAAKDILSLAQFTFNSQLDLAL